MRALVTGGAGFIGSHVVEALLARGDEVHVLDDLSKGKRENVAAGRRAARAPTSATRTRSSTPFGPRRCCTSRRRPTCASRSSGPDFDADVNVVGTVRILEAARRHGARVVFASTGGAIYGECDGPAREEAPRRPLAPYGASKLCGEEYLAT